MDRELNKGGKESKVIIAGHGVTGRRLGGVPPRSLMGPFLLNNGMSVFSPKTLGHAQSSTGSKDMFDSSCTGRSRTWWRIPC